MWFTAGDVEAVHHVGAIIWLPKGIPHQFQVHSETARVVQVPAPAQFERFVAALGRPAPAATHPEPEDIDPGRVAEGAAQFSIEVLGPPPAPPAWGRSCS